MSERGAWRWAAALGVVALAVSRGFDLFHGLSTCHPTKGSILALEYARDAGAVANIVTGEVCRAAQLSALWYDGLAFIPAYGAFLVLTALAAGGKLRWPAAAAIIVACLADEVEGVTLGRILTRLPGDAAQFALLIPVVRAKFALLGLGTLLIGGRLLQHRHWSIIPGAVVVAAAALALVCVTADARAPLMMLAFAVAWPVLVLTNLIMAFRPHRR